LFTGLGVYSPTDESVARIAATHASKKQKRPPPKTREERLAALELQLAEIPPGGLTMSSLESKQGIHMWTNLDNACVNAFSCVFALGLRFCLGWVRVLRNPCCSDLSCWLGWWQGQQNAVPLLSLLALMAFHSAWTLGKLSSTLPQGTSLLYPPSCFLFGIVAGLVALWVLNTPALLQRMNIAATPALEEWGARIVLWLRLVGVRISSNEEILLNRMMTIGRILFATLCGSLGFVLWDPLQSTVQVMVYRWQQHFKQPEKKQWSWYHAILAMSSLFLLKLLILLTYLVSGRGDISRLQVRTMAAWCDVWIMCSLVKDLLQSYMDQAIPQVSMVLSESSPAMSDRIMYPFRSRFQRLVRAGSQMVTFPFCVVALLTLGHLCHIHSNMYPAPYGEANLDKAMQSTLKSWEQTQVVTMANSASNANDFISHLSPTRANTCGETLEVKKNKRKKATIGRELLETAKPVRTSLAQALGGLQVLALMAREDKIVQTVLEHHEESIAEDDNSATIKDTGKAADELLSTLTAVLLHPILTSTIVFPLVDLLGFILCVLWMISMMVGSFTHWRTMRQLVDHHVKLACKKD
jgi:hypothetical protein